jgi:hypothetical protein
MYRIFLAILATFQLSFVASAEQGHDLEGIFVSIDGLNPNYVNILTSSGQLKSPYGFAWITKNSLMSVNAKPVITTLTAPSHVSTLTCSPPSRHGIIANNFYRNGEAVSGFAADFNAEPIWLAAKRSGKTVLALAYVGADGTTESRKADYGLAYPKAEYLSKSQVASLVGAEEKTVQIVVNAATGETKDVFLRVKAGDHVEVAIDDDADPRNGVLLHLKAHEIQHFQFTEQKEESPLRGYKRNVMTTILPTTDGTVKVYLSGSSYNNAYPDSYRTLLDNANLVWPDYGINTPDLPVDLVVRGQAEIDKFLTRVAKFSIPALNPNIVMFYQPLLDSIGHKYEAALPLPLNPANQDAVTQAYISAFQIIDENLSNLIEGHSNHAVINVMGDHGMDPVAKVVNLAPLLNAQLLSQVLIKGSGSLVMIYPKPGTDAIAVGLAMETALKGLSYEGKSVLGASYDRRNFVDRDTVNFRKEWQYGDAVWTFLGSHQFWLQFLPGSPEIFLPPPALGMHGHPESLGTMSTGYYLKSPRILKSIQLQEMSLIDAVPTFMRAVGASAPKNCLGRSLL